MQLRVCSGNEEQCKNFIGQVGQQSQRIADDWSKVTGQTVEDWTRCGEADVASYDILDRPDDAPSHLVTAFQDERPTTLVPSHEVYTDTMKANTVSWFCQNKYA
jgi:hypothetical protein